MVNENYNSKLIKQLGLRSIAYNPLFAKIGKSSSSGLYLSQLLYWYGKGQNRNEFYKSAREMTSETLLTRSQQETARKTWEGLGILKSYVRGIPPTRYFQIDINELVILVNRYVIEHVNLPELEKLFAKDSKFIRQIREDNTESTQTKLKDTSYSTSKKITDIQSDSLDRFPWEK